MTYDEESYRNIKSYDSHLQWAEQLPTPDTEPEMPQWLETTLQNYCDNPDEVIDNAEKEVQKWVKRKQELEQEWDQERAKLPRHIQQVLGKAKNVPLLREIAEAIHTPDREFVKELANGFPVCGDLPWSGTTERIPEEELPPLEFARETLLAFARKELNQRMIDRVTRSKSAGHVDQGVMDKTNKDVAAGKAFKTKLDKRNS